MLSKDANGMKDIVDSVCSFFSVPILRIAIIVFIYFRFIGGNQDRRLLSWHRHGSVRDNGLYSNVGLAHRRPRDEHEWLRYTGVQ